MGALKAPVASVPMGNSANVPRPRVQPAGKRREELSGRGPFELGEPFGDLEAEDVLVIALGVHLLIRHCATHLPRRD